MGKYHLTVFQKDGKNLLDETFEAPTNQKAKSIGLELLESHQYTDYTHRCVAPDGTLLLFQR
ncbi:YhzD family protein [Aquibacillus sediminis]|uniref:YhzD family protein n=1 Tax=Aquibacillus sediminis TaxID=2574734 RepID=UPI001107CE60|nr:YhzD family protein [Aquibacillus sediminis]